MLSNYFSDKKWYTSGSVKNEVRDAFCSFFWPNIIVYGPVSWCVWGDSHRVGGEEIDTG